MDGVGTVAAACSPASRSRSKRIGSVALEEESLPEEEASRGGKFKASKAEDGPGGGSRTHTGSDPRQILSLLRLPVPPLREMREAIES